MKIGIIPNSEDFSRPSDRRKFVRYCEIRKLKFEKAQFTKEYDILYLSGKTDITRWQNYKNFNNFYNTKIIFDASDPYLSDSKISNVIRSIYYFLSRKTKYYSLSYSHQFKKMLRVSDVIVCSSVEQKEQISSYNKNIEIIRDYFDDDIKYQIPFKDIGNKKTLNIFWEGQSHANKSIFIYLRKITEQVKDYDINLHIVTDKKYCYLGGQYFCVKTIDYLKKIFKESDVIIKFYDWNIDNLILAANKCDIGLIPIPNDKRMQLKPENKLILMWMLGLPVLTSDTESYTRTMREISEEWECKNLSDWNIKISKFLKSDILQKTYKKNVNKFSDENYTSDILTKKWDSIILE